MVRDEAWKDAMNATLPSAFLKATKTCSLGDTRKLMEPSEIDGVLDMLRQRQV